jgi:dTMP kinase
VTDGDRSPRPGGEPVSPPGREASDAGPGNPGASRRGIFVVLEGVEGVGKTTQLRLLGEALERRGFPVVLAREPGGTPVGEAVRGVLLERVELEIPPESELLLMLAARAAFVRDVVRPALDSGAVMLADRFETSTFAYQGHGRGLPLEEVRRLNAFATGGLRPDRVVVLDLPLEEGRERQRREGKAADRIERDGVAFHARVERGYRALAASDPEVVLVDARGDEPAVHARILDLLSPLLSRVDPEPVEGRRGLSESDPPPPKPAEPA